jgi:4-carboxymuconolactone decarboxylase
MAISEAAQKDHDQLFPGHVSALKVTDPELIEIFDNFAFDEALRHSSHRRRPQRPGRRLRREIAKAEERPKVVLGPLSGYATRSTPPPTTGSKAGCRSSSPAIPS